MIRFACIVGALIAVAASCPAQVIIEKHELQKGYFVKAACRQASSAQSRADQDEGWDECACEADVTYPQISGLKDIDAQASLNAGFKQDAVASRCEGDPAEKPVAPAGKELPSPSSKAHSYDVTFQSAHMLGLQFIDWQYLGGAHGNGAVSGMIIDLDKAKPLAIGDLIAPGNIAQANEAIYKALAAKPEEEVFRDQIESRKGTFIKDGKCDGCALTLTPAGVNVVFQTYEVAPYSSGNIPVTLPVQLISYPAVTQALAQQPSVSSTAVSEKK